MVTASAAHTAVEAVQVMFLVAGVAMIALCAVATIKAVRLYRRWRTRVEVALAGATNAAWWATQRDRRRMWRAVGAAEHAVSRARADGAPVGDLPSIVRQLRTAAKSVDAALAAGAMAPRGQDGPHRQASELTAAASDVTRIVTSTLTADSRPQIDRLVEAVDIEVAALRHGWSTVAVPASPRR